MTASQVRAIEVTSILSPASGYMAGGFDYTITPYGGCTFGCTFCYVPTQFYLRRLSAGWGQALQVKRNAVELLWRAARAGKLSGKRLYLSPNTDPYLPQELRARITRGLLEVMCEYPPALLVIQTRSPFVVRDLDLLRQLRDRLVVGVSITTNDEAIRRLFEPRCPSLQKRVDALAALHAAGICTQASLAPLLPCDPDQLAELVDAHADWVVAQALKHGRGAKTWEPARALLAARGWDGWLQDGADVAKAIAALSAHFSSRIHIGAEGFNLRFL